MTIANELIKMLTSASKSDARSKQTNIGPSEIGGCRHKAWRRLNGYENTNPNTLRLAAIMGTAIHGYIEEAFRRIDPFEERYLLEKEWVSDDDMIIGHIDLYDKINHEVVDWKSTKKSNLRYFPSKQQRWQVQIYGWLVEQAGHKVDTVTLVCIPRDGDERDIVFHSEPYDYSIVVEALKWLEEIRIAQYAPAPEKEASFCKLYCGFYDETGQKGCAGRPKAELEGVVIEDNAIDVVAKEYLDITKQIGELEEQKDSIKAVLEGVNGITESGIKIVWSQVAGRKTVDEKAVAEALGSVPYKYGQPTDRLAVKNVRA
jgi:hypothetical protein